MVIGERYMVSGEYEGDTITDIKKHHEIRVLRAGQQTPGYWITVEEMDREASEGTEEELNNGVVRRWYGFKRPTPHGSSLGRITQGNTIWAWTALKETCTTYQIPVIH